MQRGSAAVACSCLRLAAVADGSATLAYTYRVSRGRLRVLYAAVWCVRGAAVHTTPVHTADKSLSVRICRMLLRVLAHTGICAAVCGYVCVLILEVWRQRCVVRRARRQDELSALLLALSRALSLSLSLSLSLFLALCLSLSLALSLSRSLSLSHTHTLTHSLSLSLVCGKEGDEEASASASASAARSAPRRSRACALAR
jgi:hypothetical protein